MKSFKEFRDNGLLWAMNRYIFHPRGYALGFDIDEQEEVHGWILSGNGEEVYQFPGDMDDTGFAAFTAFLKGTTNA